MDLVPYLLVALAGGAVGWLAGRLQASRRLLQLETELARQTAQREAAEQAHEMLATRFDALAAQALDKNSEQFLRLAGERLQQYQLQAKSELEKKEKAVEELVRPISEALKKTEQQIQELERERQRAFGSIASQLQLMTEAQQLLKTETQKLVKALQRPEVRGQWGELTLRRLAELAGMVDRCDFYEQENVNTPEGRLRPDMVIRLPDERELVVDVKTPLDSYLGAMEAADETAREAHLVQHARKVRERVNELARKEYWNQFRHAPDFAILFIPGDQFLSAALDRDPGLLEDALRQKIMLATPTSFVALLKAVAYGWRQVALARNAEEIRRLGEELYQRLATFAEHMEALGRNLNKAVESHNRAVGSLERMVLPGARRFAELGIPNKKDIPELDPVENLARRLDAPETGD